MTSLSRGLNLGAIESSDSLTLSKPKYWFSSSSDIPDARVVSFHCLRIVTDVFLYLLSPNDVHDPQTPHVTSFHWTPSHITFFIEQNSVLYYLSVTRKGNNSFTTCSRAVVYIHNGAKQISVLYLIQVSRLTWNT